MTKCKRQARHIPLHTEDAVRSRRRSRLVATPLRWPATPLRRPATPLRRPATPLRRRATPLRRRATPLQRPATPLRRRATPLRRRATPLRRRATPLRRPATASRRTATASRRTATASRRTAITRLIQRIIDSTIARTLPWRSRSCCGSRSCTRKCRSGSSPSPRARLRGPPRGRCTRDGSESAPRGDARAGPGRGHLGRSPRRLDGDRHAAHCLAWPHARVHRGSARGRRERGPSAVRTTKGLRSDAYVSPSP
jgi:hypothetical protein